MDSTFALYANFGIALSLAGVVAYFAFIDDDGDDGEDMTGADTDSDAREDDTPPGEDTVLIEDLIAAAPTLGEDASPDVRSSVATADTLEGGDSADTLDGSAETLSRAYNGGGGDDLILAAKQADVADGGEGNDTIRPAAGDDISYGGTGDDQIVDGFGRDIQFGGGGDDQLFLDNSDQATGGDGADLFTIDEAAVGEAAVTINDFDAAADEIAIEYTGVDDAPPPEVSVSTLDSGTQISLDDQPIATVTGVAEIDPASVTLIDKTEEEA